MVGAMLEVESCSVSFGGVRALDSLCFSVDEGEVKGLVGPNGAGKSTFFNAATGFVRHYDGSVKFVGHELNGLRPHQIARMGIGRTFQQNRVIREMSVLENVLVGSYCSSSITYLDVLLGNRRNRKFNETAREGATSALRTVGLAHVTNQLAGQLPVGQERLLQIARALAMQPVLLLLDEPAAGLNDLETETLAGVIRHINSNGVTIILVEHNMELVMGVSDTIVCLNYGRCIAQGTPQQIQDDQAVIDAYLGRAEGVEGASAIC